MQYFTLFCAYIGVSVFTHTLFPQSSKDILYSALLSFEAAPTIYLLNSQTSNYNIALVFLLIYYIFVAALLLSAPLAFISEAVRHQNRISDSVEQFHRREATPFKIGNQINLVLRRWLCDQTCKKTQKKKLISSPPNTKHIITPSRNTLLSKNKFKVRLKSRL